MSAFEGKADIIQSVAKSPLIAISGHQATNLLQTALGSICEVLSFVIVSELSSSGNVQKYG
jgi:hypothetical protein